MYTYSYKPEIDEIIDNFGISEEEADRIYCEIDDFDFEVIEENFGFIIK